jgi:hypothetical protein
MKTRAFQVTFFALLLIVSCNKEDYYGVSVAVEGIDAVCSAGVDVSSCEIIEGCQAAFEDVESVEPVFAACIANPPEEEVIISPPEPGEEVDEVEVPTVSEVYANNCRELDEKYLYVKNYSGKGQSKKVKKVKLCHQTSDGEHVVIVACPALKAHRAHEDYLGACKPE